VPAKLTSTLGADIVRLWIAATDYANEMSVSEEILKRMADSYRRMRNTLRFLLGNMNGFDPAEHAVEWHELVAIDQWAIAKAFALQNDVVTAYRNYEFHDIYQKITISASWSSAASTSTSSRTACTPPALRALRAVPRRPRCTTSPPRWCAGLPPS